MRRNTIKLLLLLLLSPIALWAQGACTSGQVLTSRQGFSNLAAVVPQASVVVSPGPIYSNAALSAVISGNTITADSYGNFAFCAAPSAGPQTITITGPNFNTLSYPWVPGQVLNAPGTWTATNSYTGSVSFSGPVAFTGGVSFTAFPVFTNILTQFINPPPGAALFVSGSAQGATCGVGSPCAGYLNFASPSGTIGGNVTLSAGNGYNLQGGNLLLFGGSGVPIGTIQTNTVVSEYNSIYTVRNGLPSEVASVDLTSQNAAITTTTLYAVPTAGQFRLTWNAKVTTAAGSSSTLGALTITYVDPDGITQTITAPASVEAGTIATTSAGNSTTTALLGLPLTLNCKSGTMTYAFAYASNAANVMTYNLHLTLEEF